MEEEKVYMSFHVDYARDIFIEIINFVSIITVPQQVGTEVQKNLLVFFANHTGMFRMVI